jgi:hypothetical protein
VHSWPFSACIIASLHSQDWVWHYSLNMFFTPARYHMLARNHFLFLCFLPYPCFKKTKVAAPFSTQFSRIHTGTCPAVPIAHAATCSLCGVCCCPEHARILWFNSRDQGVGEATVLKQCHARAISQKTLVDIFLRAWAHLVVTINTGLNNFLQRHLWTWIHDFAQSKHKSD